VVLGRGVARSLKGKDVLLGAIDVASERLVTPEEVPNGHRCWRAVLTRWIGEPRQRCSDLIQARRKSRRQR